MQGKRCRANAVGDKAAGLKPSHTPNMAPTSRKVSKRLMNRTEWQSWSLLAGNGGEWGLSLC